MFLSALFVLITINTLISPASMTAPHLLCPTNTMETIHVSTSITLDIQVVLLDIGLIPLITCALLSAQQVISQIKLNNFVLLSAPMAITLTTLTDFAKQAVL